MSKQITPIPFRELMTWITAEYQREGSVFGVAKPFRATPRSLPIFGRQIETPIGPAAGPHTRFAQNIIAAYFAGARFFELETVRTRPGDGSSAIDAFDECCYNGSPTPLSPREAFAEYVKAWCACKIMAKLWGLGDGNGFVFHMAVGCDPADVKSESVQTFLAHMADASETAEFQDCLTILKELFPEEADYIDTIDPHISNSVTLTAEGSVSAETLEALASGLMKEQRLHLFVKCAPTLLGCDYARYMLSQMEYSAIQLDEQDFLGCMQYDEAVALFGRLQDLAVEQGLEFGVKMGASLPIAGKRSLSGKALYALTLSLAYQLARDLKEKCVRISYAGGADAFHAAPLFECEIWPITMTSTLLKPGGYQRLTQIACQLVPLMYGPFGRVNVHSLRQVAQRMISDMHLVKINQNAPSYKLDKPVPLLDCFTAPCKQACPIGQDIPAYLELAAKGKYVDALRVITDTNPLPFITGCLCTHPCMDKCIRGHYDKATNARFGKLIIARMAYDAYMDTLEPPVPARTDAKVAVIGGGTTGMSAAYFVGRAGIPVTLFERAEKLGGVVRYIAPDSRISDEDVDKDAALMMKMGVDVRLNTEAPSVAALKASGYTHIFIATGAWNHNTLDIARGSAIPAFDWLRDFRAKKDVPLGHVVVVGGGNVAVDTARAAMVAGAASSTLLYRRTRSYMTANHLEIEKALADGVQLAELAIPVEKAGSKLLCSKLVLGPPDANGRQSAMDFGNLTLIPCDTVITALGESVHTGLFTENGIEVNENGFPSFRTNLEGVYAGGAAIRRASDVVDGIADARAFAQIVIGDLQATPAPADAQVDPAAAIAKKGILSDMARTEGDRCLNCAVVCQVCADVCPSRANVPVILPDGRRQILHVDHLCCDCGNCATFCPYASSPARDKFTLFSDPAPFGTSVNQGFLPLGDNRVLVRLEGQVFEADASADERLPADIALLIRTVLTDYGYLL